MSFFKSRAKTSGEASVPKKLPWSEKYRPKTLTDVASQDTVVDTLAHTLKSSNIPHMLFYGPPGTGKTSTILALAKDMFGPELFKSRVLELNASDDRGISVVRDKIKTFAKTVVSTPSRESAEKYPCPPYKIIILDEADSMTQDAQAALRRTMENYSRITRFCLVCNYVTRIIDPLASRCSKFRFKPINEDAAFQRLTFIADQEQLKFQTNSNDVLKHLFQVCNGDLRKAITLMQSAYRVVGIEGKIDNNVVNEVSGYVPEESLSSLINAIRSGAPKPIQKAVSDVVLDGWSITQLVSQLHDRLIMDPSLADDKKTKAAQCLSLADRQLTDGTDESLVLLNVAMELVGYV